MNRHVHSTNLSTVPYEVLARRAAGSARRRAACAFGASCILLHLEPGLSLPGRNTNECVCVEINLCSSKSGSCSGIDIRADLCDLIEFEAGRFAERSVPAR